MKKYIFSIMALASLGLTSCNDSFLDEKPKIGLTEETAFHSYEDFTMYAWPLYKVFTNGTIGTSLANWMEYGPYRSDANAGYLSIKYSSSSNPYAYQKIRSKATGNGWDFHFIRRVNLMLKHIDDSEMNQEEKDHWRAIGYFFHSYWYAELIDRFGDIPWITTVLSDKDKHAYGPRLPRKEVADNVLKRLLWAKDHIGNFEKQDGKNTITIDVINAFISRYTLREATWRKYHELGDWKRYLEFCRAVSGELMQKYPRLYKGVDGQPAAGYGEMWTTENLEGVPGIILYKSYVDNINNNGASYIEHTSSQYMQLNHYTVSLYLMKNGMPIANNKSGFHGDKDMYAEFRDRDPRLYHTVIPPYRVKQGKGEYRTWSFTENPADREYIDIMGLNTACANPGIGMKRLPAQNWSASVVPEIPRLKNGYVSCSSGYYLWKNYDCWEKSLNSAGGLNTADKPIFKIEEILLNDAEAAFELGVFNQDVADKTINLLRERAEVSPMVVADINENFDPNRAKYYPKGNSEGVFLDPILWEIRRERIIELMGEGFGFYDIRRWRMAPWFLNRAPVGIYTTKEEAKKKKMDLYNPKTGYSDGPQGTMTEGYLFLFNNPVKENKGWLEKYYLYQVPTEEIILNHDNLTQNPGW